LTLKGDYLFHGSNNIDIDIFEPREQTLYNGKLTKAIFATAEPIWSIFYAVFDRSRLVGSFRNGCIVFKNKKYHFYSLNESTMKNSPWTEGKIYILPRNKFSKSDNGYAHFDEWISHDYVRPISQLLVNVDDFYFMDKVATHKDKESLLKTWLFYKARTLKAESKKASKSR
jgi:hypothetical protein